MTDNPSTYKGSVVVIDDEENMCKILTRILNLIGYHVTYFTNPEKGIEYVKQYNPDIVLSDIRMPEMGGMDVMKAVHKVSKDIEVIMITAFGTIEEAIQAMKQGAFHYITKPFKSDELIATIDKALEHKRLKEDNISYSQHLSREYANIDLIGETEQMKDIKQLIKKISPTDSAVLIRGESGTGKELVAKAIHKYSRRAEKRFVAINCASSPEHLLESELFGYEKGAFTGATQTKQGLIEMAHGGTLFLDEIGDLPLSLQGKMLRVLQEREIQRVGGLKQISIDIRLLAATNKDLQKAIEDGQFRKDLFYRLNVITIYLPPLRERLDDIEMLVKHFISKISQKLKKPDVKYENEIIEYLRVYPWPGNVRELENVIERVIVLIEGTTLTPESLPEDIIFSGERGAKVSQGETAEFADYSDKDYKEAKDTFDKDYISNLLKKAKGSVTEAAKLAGMSRRNFYDKMEKFNVKAEEYK